ncbi:MAG: hypothetical protein ACK4PI_12015 [Tepidisphaerales bacterium]
MFGFGRRKKDAGSQGGHAGPPAGPQVSTRLCTDRLKGRYPHVGLYDCREGKVWVARPLDGQAIRTSHARLITGADNQTGVVWKDRFLCFWLYTPDTAPADLNGYPIEASDGHLVVRIDPHWDYDRQRLIPPELTDQVDNNLERQSRHGERVFRWYLEQKIDFPLALHLVGQRLTDSRFYVRRYEPPLK